MFLTKNGNCGFSDGFNFVIQGVPKSMVGTEGGDRTCDNKARSLCGVEQPNKWGRFQKKRLDTSFIIAHFFQ